MAIKVLFDTNVILDVILDRKPFSKSSLEALKLAETKRITGLITSSSVTDIYYVINKELKNHTESLEKLSTLLKIVKVAKVDSAVIKTAMKLRWKDFEDCVQFVATKKAHAKVILTRNKRTLQQIT